jgi:DNA-binding winged helix-turn-helix (wHTH) protein/predicted ATPase
MAPGDEWQFGPFQLDVTDKRLRRGTAAIVLRPKSFAVLHYLLTHTGRLVARDEVLQAVWPGIAVSEAVLTVCIGEIRRALGDARQTPKYIETVSRRGYRFIGATTRLGLESVSGLEGWPSATPRPQIIPSLVSLGPRCADVRPVAMVGREAELAQLEQWLEQARRGVRQTVFVAGEAGIGKTTLVDAFCARVVVAASLWLARGQCISHYGAGEAYLPVLDALGRLCRAPGSESVIACLARYAPTWLVQMIALISAAELEALQRQVWGATRERMLRELAEAVEALTVERPLVLVLEDLHWSDFATLDLISWLAQRREPAQLLVLGTYRPVEVIVRGHPLQAVKQELMGHRQAVELPLELLTEADITQYLAARIGVRGPRTPVLQDLARAMHRRTDGHPLFMTTVVDTLVRQGWLVEGEGHRESRAGIEAAALQVPESLRQLVELLLDQLSAEDQRVLEAASVVGMESSAAAVAAGLEEDVEAIDERCAALARRGQFLQASGSEEWPDGTLAGRYRFRHTLYQQVVYERVPAGRRRPLHRRIGMQQEAGYGEQSADHAAALATHFEHGGEYRRAVRYRRQAAENALRRSAYREAIDHLSRGLAVLPRLPDSPERARLDLDLQLVLGQALTVTLGPGAPRVEQVYAKADDLCREVGETSQRVAVLRGLRRAYQGRGEPRAAHPLAEQFLTLAEQAQDTTLLTEAYMALGVSSFYLGEVAVAHTHLQRSLSLYDSQPPHAHVFPSGQDLGVLALTYDAMALWMLGYPNQARERARQALHLAQELSQPWTSAAAVGYATVIDALCGNWLAVHEQAGVAIQLATEQGFHQWVARATMLRGLALAERGQRADGLAQMRQGMAIWRATGQQLGQPFWLALLAEQYGKAAQVEEGQHLLSEALAATHTKELRVWEAELHRLQGELLLRHAVGKGDTGANLLKTDAQNCFRQAIDTARHQHSRSLELRAAMSLSRLWQRQGNTDAARQTLSECYNWFTEGFDTTDLQEAKALLEQLRR